MSKNGKTAGSFCDTKSFKHIGHKGYQGEQTLKIALSPNLCVHFGGRSGGFVTFVFKFLIMRKPCPDLLTNKLNCCLKKIAAMNAKDMARIKFAYISKRLPNYPRALVIFKSLLFQITAMARNTLRSSKVKYLKPKMCWSVYIPNV